MRDQPFPFWPLALAIATGILIANAVTWLAAETRLRYELRQVDMQLSAERDAARAKEQQRVRERQASLTRQYDAEFRAKAQAEREASLAADNAAIARANDAARIQRDEREGEYFRPATDDLKPGTYACKDRVIAKRTDSGWEPATLGDGRPARCRTEL